MTKISSYEELERRVKELEKEAVERKCIDEELRIKDSAIASAIDGIALADLEGNITYVNHAALKMWGGDDPSEVLGMSALDLAQSREEAEEIHRVVLEKGGWSGEMAGFRKDGSPIKIHFSASLVRNEQGEPICLMDSFIDITERKKMEEELLIKDRAIASSLQGFAITDLEGNIIYINDAAARMWGTDDPGEILGRSALELAQFHEEAVKVLHEIIENGSWEGEITGKKKDGSLIIIRFSSNIVYNDKGEPICIVDSFVDITVRKKAEEALKKSEAELRQLSSRLLQAHEEESRRIGQELHDGLAQSMVAIKVWVEAALLNVRQKNFTGVAKSLETVVPLAQGAVEEVRRIARNLRPSILDDLGILATISWLCQEFERMYPDIGIEKQIEIQENDVPDSLKIVIFRILQESLNNIVKHSQATLVRLSLKETGGSIELTIEDNGVGFDMDHVISGELSERGLGLASMKERAELFGGSFSLVSQKGAGTTVHASWPIR